MEGIDSGRNFPVGTKKNHGKPDRIFGVQAEIRTPDIHRIQATKVTASPNFVAGRYKFKHLQFYIDKHVSCYRAHQRHNWSPLA
jgi:hypothetical protein